MKKLVIGIASQQAIRARALAISRGDHQPRPNEPKIWFTSMRLLAEVLSDDNRALLRVIREQKPASLSQLAEFTGRAPSNLSRTLKTMERYGLVEMRRTLRNVQPVATASEFVIRAAQQTYESSCFPSQQTIKLPQKVPAKKGGNVGNCPCRICP